MMNMQQIEAWPVSQIQTPSPALFLSEEELRRELGTPMVDIGQDLAARARFDPKAAERTKPALNSRLIAAGASGVTFKYKDYRVEGPERHKVMTLAPHEFIRRFLLHVLPKGFHRIRQLPS